MKDRISILTVVLVVLLIISVGYNAIQAVRIQKLKNTSVSLLPGETIDYFDLVGVDNQAFTSAMLNKDKIYLFYIFGIPCTTCNKNITPWKTLTDYFDQHVTAIGIIPDDVTDALNFSQEQRLNFPLFLPVDVGRLRKSIRLRTKLPQTLVIHDNEVKSVTIGDLDSESYLGVIETVKVLMAHNLKVKTYKNTND